MPISRFNTIEIEGKKARRTGKPRDAKRTILHQAHDFTLSCEMKYLAISLAESNRYLERRSGYSPKRLNPYEILYLNRLNFRIKYIAKVTS